MKSKMKLLLSCFLVLFVITFLTSCGDDDEPKKAAIPDVYFISYETELIQKFPSDDPANLTTFLDVAGFSGPGLAFNSKNNKLYFSDFYDYYVGKIWSVDIDATTPVADDIVGDLYEPYSIAIDEAEGKIYYADGADLEDEDPQYHISHIYRANLDGSSATPIISMEGALFRPVAIDTKNDKLYFYDVELENLYEANLDGTGDPEIILAGAYGYAIAVDSKNGKIYFDDQRANGGDGALMMDDLDGSYPLTPTTVDNTASRIYGIAIDAGNKKLYWSGRDTGAIYKSDLNGANKITLKDGLTEPRGIALVK